MDADAGEFGLVRYELVRGSGELFAVNTSTGEVTLRQPLAAAEKAFVLTIAAYDGGKMPLSSQAQLNIRVVSATGPVFSAGWYSGEVLEDAEQGTAIGRVEAATPSSSPLLYTLVGGNHGGLFRVEYAQGVVTVAAPLDFETQRRHLLTVSRGDEL